VVATVDFVMVALSAFMIVAAAAMLIRWIRAGASPEPPLELRALLILSLAIAVVDTSAMAIAPDARELFVQRFGDLGIPSAIIATVVTTLVVERRNGTRSVLLVVMGFLSFLHLLSPVRHFGEAEGSPRTFLGVIIPLVWVAVLLSPRVRTYCTGTSAVAT